jgi:hypothetical protein
VRPEEAVDAAREAAAAARARGAYADADEVVRAATEPLERISTEQLVEWAVIEPDLDRVRSTRRTGAPITAVKRALVHVLRQYFAEAHAQQTRFNLHAVIRIAELEERLERAEAELARRPPGGAA